jgi:hypothetical protein
VTDGHHRGTSRFHLFEALEAAYRPSRLPPTPASRRGLPALRIRRWVGEQQISLPAVPRHARGNNGPAVEALPLS